jgi:hypothetical protein
MINRESLTFSPFQKPVRCLGKIMFNFKSVRRVVNLSGGEVS